jgi:hypothetical protein
VGIGVDEGKHKITLIVVTPPCPDAKPDTSVVAVVESKRIDSTGELAESTFVVRPEPGEPVWAFEEMPRQQWMRGPHGPDKPPRETESDSPRAP